MTTIFSFPLLCALGAAVFIWLMTSLGASVVFFFQRLSPRFHLCSLGLTCGIMLAACFWSLIAPALERAEEQGAVGWLVVSAGIASGVGLLLLTDALIRSLSSASDPKDSLLLLSITLHNIPEGLAVGVAFGTLQSNPEPAAVAAAFSVALGIGIQNIPEGAATALPLRKSGLSPKNSFLRGVLSGAVEPPAALLGATLVVFIHSILPFSLAFAAGAMLYVVLQELIPEAVSLELGEGKRFLCSTVAGFLLMMILDVSLG